MSVIRQHAASALANEIWNRLRASQIESVRGCPGCTRSLKTFDVEDLNGRTELDGCVACQFFWFDSSELARLGIVLKELPPAEVRRAVADMRVEALRENRKAQAAAETIRDLLLWSHWMW